MKKTADPRCTQQTSKKMVIFLLYLFASLIAAMGVGYTVYSLYYGVDLQVMNNAVPSAVFGIIITFLGIRYLWAVYKLSLKLDSPEAVFSWMNYRHSSKEGMR